MRINMAHERNKVCPLVDRKSALVAEELHRTPLGAGDKFIRPNQRVSQAPKTLGEHFIQHIGHLKRCSEPSLPCFMRRLFSTWTPDPELTEER